MYQIPVAATLTFAVAGTFSPGPNNVMSASLGVMYGYRRSLPFIAGVTCGFTVVMLVCAAAAALLLGALPAIEPYLKYVGAAYILWLAWTTWSKRAEFGKAVGEKDVPRSHGFPGGFVLQFANPKAIVYGLMMYSTFLAALASKPVPLAVSAVALALLSMTSTSLWSVSGMTVRRWLRTDRDRAIIAGVLSLTLVYTAVELSGLPALVGSLIR